MHLFRNTAMISALSIALLFTQADGQSRHNSKAGDTDGTVISVTANRTDGKKDPITANDLFLYENGITQKISNFAFDPSPARIVLLVDNSQTLPTPLDDLKKATMEFAYEIFDGDQLFVIAYDTKPEIIQEWTDDAKKIEASMSLLRKQGNPSLMDAIRTSISEVLVPLMPGTRKTAVVIIGDGLDRESKSNYDTTLSELLRYNVTVYALQLADRTGGAYRRDKPKANAMITGLTEATGGRAFPFEDAQAAAKAICDELRKDRYLLSYQPVNTSTYDARKLFLIGNDGINIRTKASQPPTVK